MSLCLLGCAGPTLLQQPLNCVVNQRLDSTISRLIFFACQTQLPSPITCENIMPLFESGAFIATSPLANITLADPTTEDVIYNECAPAYKKTVGRDLTFEDHYAVSETQSSPATSPATSNPYFDYTFWDSLVNQFTQLRCGIVYCNGDVRIARNLSGFPMTFNLQAFISYQKPSTQGAGWVEFKKGTISFQGDPLGGFLPPDFNLDECGITI